MPIRPLTKLALGTVVAVVVLESAIRLFAGYPAAASGRGLWYSVLELRIYFVCLIAGFLAARRGSVIPSAFMGVLAAATAAMFGELYVLFVSHIEHTLPILTATILLISAIITGAVFGLLGGLISKGISRVLRHRSGASLGQ